MEEIEGEGEKIDDKRERESREESERGNGRVIPLLT